VLEIEDLLPISALQHWSYCHRQCALIHLEQAFEENVHTMRGQAVHAHVDTPGYEQRAGMRVERALPIWSERLGLIGKADIVEFAPDGTPYPVEYKHGRKRPAEHDDLQLSAQAMCLEEMTGRRVPSGAIFYASSKRRREVQITPSLRTEVESTVAAVRTMLVGGVLPPPVNDKRCRECSLREICQPQAIAGRARLEALSKGLFKPD
jgi:CRISPR-associated exonuclease Cas4